MSTPQLQAYRNYPSEKTCTAAAVKCRRVGSGDMELSAPAAVCKRHRSKSASDSESSEPRSNPEVLQSCDRACASTDPAPDHGTAKHAAAAKVAEKWMPFDTAASESIRSKTMKLPSGFRSEWQGPILTFDTVNGVVTAEKMTRDTNRPPGMNAVNAYVLRAHVMWIACMTH